MKPATMADDALTRKEAEMGLTFEAWLRTVCFQAPTPEAYDLAKCAWEAVQSRSLGAIDLRQFVNAAHIGGADSPHIVVEKLQAVINRSLSFESVREEALSREAVVKLRDIVLGEGELGWQVWLEIGNQHFPVGNAYDVQSEAEWYADMLRKAIRALSPARVAEGEAAAPFDMMAELKSRMTSPAPESPAKERRLIAHSGEPFETWWGRYAAGRLLTTDDRNRARDGWLAREPIKHLLWAASWIENSAQGQDTLVVEFATNMAMTIRAEAHESPAKEQPEARLMTYEWDKAGGKYCPDGEPCQKNCERLCARWGRIQERRTAKEQPVEQNAAPQEPRLEVGAPTLDQIERKSRGEPAAAAPNVAAMVRGLNDEADTADRLGHPFTADLLRKAAALIEKLGQGWIPVSERLPELDDFYWCMTKCPPQSHPQQAIRFRDGEWYTSWPVTHWMPLPKPPK